MLNDRKGGILLFNSLFFLCIFLLFKKEMLVTLHDQVFDFKLVEPAHVVIDPRTIPLTTSNHHVCVLLGNVTMPVGNKPDFNTSVLPTRMA